LSAERGLSMRVVHTAVFLAVTTSPALAQREPQIVIPGRADVPVIINGINASWGVVVGEFGLDRPGEMAPVVIYQPLLLSAPTVVPGYFPKDGKKPGYGRLEINPPADRPLPPPAPTYYRSWTSQSGAGPVTEYPAYPMPPVIVEPTFGGRRHGPPHGPPLKHGVGPHDPGPSAPAIPIIPPIGP
jgi:hypothetical protein